MEKKFYGNYTIILQAVLNKYWRQHLTKQQLYGHLQPITKTIQIRRTKHVIAQSAGAVEYTDCTSAEG